jgi:hypothetical protein
MAASDESAVPPPRPATEPPKPAAEPPMRQQVDRSGICLAGEILHHTQGRVDVSEDLGRLTNADSHRANLSKKGSRRATNDSASPH